MVDGQPKMRCSRESCFSRLELPLVGHAALLPESPRARASRLTALTIRPMGTVNIEAVETQRFPPIRLVCATLGEPAGH